MIIVKKETKYRCRNFKDRKSISRAKSHASQNCKMSHNDVWDMFLYNVSV